MHIAKANTEYKHPFLVKRDTVKRVGVIVVTTDKGLCGGLNTNVLRLVLQRFKEWRGNGHRRRLRRDRQQGPRVSCNRLGGNIVSSVVQLGDRPRLDRLVGPVKVLMDKYIDGSDRRDAHLLHEFRQHDEAGAAARSHRADPRRVPHADRRGAHGEGRRRLVGLHLRARRARAARRHDAPLHRSDRSSRW